MNSKTLAIALFAALPLTFGMARAVSAHDSGYNGRIDREYRSDGTRVDHEYGRHGKHIDHEYRPDGTHIDHEYGRNGKHVDHEYRQDGQHIDHDYTSGRHVDRHRSRSSYGPYYGGDPYRYDRGRYHTHSPWYDRSTYGGYYERNRYPYGRYYPYRRYDDRDVYRGRYDPYDGYYGGDPYGYGGGSYYGSGGSFDWKRDWPFFLGAVINGTR
jgi:hypothetical protein